MTRTSLIPYRFRLSHAVCLPFLAGLALLLGSGSPLHGDDGESADRPTAPAPAADPVPVPGDVVQQPDRDADEDESRPAPPEDNRPESETESPLARRSREAVERGLEWLADEQQDNGSWKNDVGYKLNYSYMVTRNNGDHPGVTAIACLAYMAGGHMPGRGRYGEVVRKGLKFVLSCIKEDGGVPGFITHDGTRMYSHAFATLFLAEVLGMANLSSEEEDEVRKKLRLAVSMIVASQNDQGAWRYSPNAQDSDMSICVCQLQALRAARNVGIRIPPSTIKRALSYISHSYKSYGTMSYNENDPRPYERAPRSYRDGTFVYQNDQRDGSRVSWTLCAAGVCALQQVGSYDSFVGDDGARHYLHKSIYYLRNQMPYSVEACRRQPRIPFGYFYGHYYAAQAVYQYSRKYPEVWPQWLADIRQKFVLLHHKESNEKGYWSDAIGKHYATAMACLILQIHQEYLPIFHK